MSDLFKDILNGQLQLPIGPSANNSNLGRFIASIKKEGLARGNRFASMITKPKTLLNSNFDYNMITLFCESAQLPGLTFETTEVRTYGETREVPYDRLYENVNLSFYVDNSMQVKDFFDQWIGSIVNPNSRHAAYYDDYITTVVLVQYDIQENAKYIVTLHEAYPKAIAPMTLDNNTHDFHKLGVSMNYKFWEAQLVTTSDVEATQKSIIDPIAANAFRVLNRFNPGLSSDLSNIYLASSSYFNRFGDFQRKANEQFRNFGSGIVNGI